MMLSRTRCFPHFSFIFPAAAKNVLLFTCISTHGGRGRNAGHSSRSPIDLIHLYQTIHHVYIMGYVVLNESMYQIMRRYNTRRLIRRLITMFLFVRFNVFRYAFRL